jgi:hypothetical protein
MLMRSTRTYTTEQTMTRRTSKDLTIGRAITRQMFSLKFTDGDTDPDYSSTGNFRSCPK